MSLISIGTLGGTIAMVEGGSGGGVVPTLTADALIAAVPQIRNYAQIDQGPISFSASQPLAKISARP